MLIRQETSDIRSTPREGADPLAQVLLKLCGRLRQPPAQAAGTDAEAISARRLAHFRAIATRVPCVTRGHAAVMDALQECLAGLQAPHRAQASALLIAAQRYIARRDGRDDDAPH